MKFKAILKTPLHLFLQILVLLMSMPTVSWAEDFAIFDGRVYNGKFYPRIDIIEWGSPSHMEFQIYSKKMPIELSFELEGKTGKPVMLVRYNIKDRNEQLCRRVVAPSHFKEGMALHVYKDVSDKDMDNIIVSPSPIPPSEGMVEVKQSKYAACSDSSASDRLPASREQGHEPNAAAEPEDAAPEASAIEDVSPGGAFLKW